MTTWINAFADSFEPDVTLLPSEWSNTYRVLDSKSSAEAGKYRIERTPYLKEIIDRTSLQDPTQKIAVIKSAQCGITTMMMNVIGYYIHNQPSPMLFVAPSNDLAKKISQLQLEPMLQSADIFKPLLGTLSSKQGKNTMLFKQFPGGTLMMVGSNAGTQLRSMSVRVLILDELDAYKQDVSSDGSPVDLAVSRTVAFSRSRKIIYASTPTIKDCSAIEREYLRGDQRKWNVPCPECGNYDTIDWSNIKWENRDPSTVYLECQNCQHHIQEYELDYLNANGKWVPTATPKEAHMVSYQISALFSPWYSWQQAVSDFLKAKDAGKDHMQVWQNNVLGEPYIDNAVYIEPHQVLKRRKPYPGGAECPAEALAIFAGIDVHPSRFEITTCGMGKNNKLYLLDHFVVEGNVQDINTQDELDNVLSKVYVDTLGNHKRILASCLDTAGGSTQAMYTYLNSKPASKKIWGIVGRSGSNRPVIAPSTNKAVKADLYIVGVDGIKSMILDNLNIEDDSPGRIYIPTKACFDDHYAKSLTAERRITRRVQGRLQRGFVQTYARNEALDCLTYAIAAFTKANPNLEEFEQYYSKSPEDRKPKQKNRIKVLHRPH